MQPYQRRASSLIAGVPLRVVAVNHDTSVMMLERNYAKYIADHRTRQFARRRSKYADHHRSSGGAAGIEAAMSRRKLPLESPDWGPITEAFEQRMQQTGSDMACGAGFFDQELRDGRLRALVRREDGRPELLAATAWHNFSR